MSAHITLSPMSDGGLLVIIPGEQLREIAASFKTYADGSAGYNTGAVTGEIGWLIRQQLLSAREARGPAPKEPTLLLQ